MRRWRVLQETQGREEIIARVAALDIGKAELACCVRVPAEGRRGRDGPIPRRTLGGRSAGSH